MDEASGTRDGSEQDAAAIVDGDLILIRAALQRTPAERIAAVVATYPLVRAGLLRRRAAGGDPRP